MKFSAIIATAGLVASAAAKDVEVCKGVGFVDCVPVSSAWTCDNLVSGGEYNKSPLQLLYTQETNRGMFFYLDGRPFVSGRVTSWGSCDIFSENGCSGISNTMDTEGWSKFPFNVKSIRC
jgi:hypothetical protein